MCVPAYPLRRPCDPSRSPHTAFFLLHAPDLHVRHTHTAKQQSATRVSSNGRTKRFWCEIVRYHTVSNIRAFSVVVCARPNSAPVSGWTRLGVVPWLRIWHCDATPLRRQDNATQQVPPILRASTTTDHSSRPFLSHGKKKLPTTVNILVLRRGDERGRGRGVRRLSRPTFPRPSLRQRSR